MSGTVCGAGDSHEQGQCLSSRTYWLAEHKSMKEQIDILHIAMNSQSETSMGIVKENHGRKNSGRECFLITQPKDLI